MILIKKFSQLLLFAGIFVISFEFGPEYSVAQTQNKPSISLGFIMDVTGPAAPLGEDCRQGFEIARNSFAPSDTINGLNIQFTFGDSKGEPKTAVTEFSRMVDSEKALAVLISRTHLATAVNPLSSRKKVSLLASSANPTFVDDNNYAFRIWVRADQEGEALAQKAIEKKIRKISIITTEDDYLMAMSQTFKSSFIKLGGEIVSDETIDKEFVDFSPLVSRVKAKNPDAVFINVGIPQLSIA